MNYYVGVPKQIDDGHKKLIESNLPHNEGDDGVMIMLPHNDGYIELGMRIKRTLRYEEFDSITCISLDCPVTLLCINEDNSSQWCWWLNLYPFSSRPFTHDSIPIRCGQTNFITMTIFRLIDCVRYLNKEIYYFKLTSSYTMKFFFRL